MTEGQDAAFKALSAAFYALLGEMEAEGLILPENVASRLLGVQSDDPHFMETVEGLAANIANSPFADRNLTPRVRLVKDD